LNLGAEKRIRELSIKIDEFLTQVVADRKKVSEGTGYQDVLLMFIEQYRKRGVEINEPFLRDIAIAFIIAGRDTTGWTLTALCYLLSKHPEVERKALEEIQSVYSPGEDPSYDKSSQLQYVQAVIYETLRLYPPVATDVKYAQEKDKLPDGTQIEPGQAIVYTIWSQGRNPRLWENPLKFDPERWLEDGKFVQKSEHEFTVFNSGPRLCLGKGLASFQLKTVLSLLLPRFSFQTLPDQDFIPFYSATLYLPHGLPVYLKSRS